MITAALNVNEQSNLCRRRSLLWKDLRESRVVLIWSVSLAAAIVAGDSALNMLLAGPNNVTIQGPDATILLLIIWFIAAALSGSSIAAPEIGASTLALLASLPLSRKRIWWTKLLAAVIVYIVTVPIVTVFWFAILRLIQGNREIIEIPFAVLPDFAAQLAQAALFIFSVFSIGTVVTMFTDKALSAFFVTIVAAICWASLLDGFWSLLTPEHHWLVWALVAAAIFKFLAISYQLFVHGETLRTIKRYKILLSIVVNTALPILAAMIITYLWLIL